MLCIRYLRLFDVYYFVLSTFIDNFPIRIYVNKIKNRTTFRIESGYCLQFLTSETMKLFKSTKNKLTKGEDGENVPRLEITEVVLVHCNIVSKWLSTKLKSLVYICS